MRAELVLQVIVPAVCRYTRPCEGGTLSIYAAFSHFKHLVVQFAQRPFWPFISIFNMPEIITIDTKFLAFLFLLTVINSKFYTILEIP